MGDPKSDDFGMMQGLRHGLYFQGMSDIITIVLTYFIWDAALVVSDTFKTILIKIGNMDKYLAETCSGLNHFL